MKFASLLAIVLAVFLSIGSAMAVPAGKVEFAGGAAGKVVFDGKAHKDAGMKCGDCHNDPTKLFEKKKGSNKITMADINAGKFCGACHDGKKAFKASDAANCKKCHTK